MLSKLNRRLSFLELTEFLMVQILQHLSCAVGCFYEKAAGTNIPAEKHRNGLHNFSLNSYPSPIIEKRGQVRRWLLSCKILKFKVIE
jgi:hypothetical protein